MVRLATSISLFVLPERRARLAQTSALLYSGTVIRGLFALSVALYGGCQLNRPAEQKDSESSLPSKKTESEKTSESETPTNEDSADKDENSSEESKSTDSSSTDEDTSIEPVDPVQLPPALCRPLAPLPDMSGRKVSHWLTVDADMLGASALAYNPVKLRLSPQRVDLITGLRPIVLDFSKKLICAYASPFRSGFRVADTLPLSGGESLLVFFQGGTAVMGRYSEQGTHFQELPRGASGNASKFVKIEAQGDREACIAAEFGDHRLQLSFDQGDHWSTFPGKSLPYNFGALLDRKGQHLWTYGMFAMEAMDLKWYTTSNLLSPETSGQIIDFGEKWESNTIDAAIADPHKDATLIVGSGTDSDPGPIVGTIGLNAMGVPVPMRVLWQAGAESPLSVVAALWADPQTPDRLFVGGFTKKAGDPPLLVVQAGKLRESIKFPGQENYELRALGELEAARPDQKGVLLAGVNVDGEVRLYLVRAR